MRRAVIGGVMAALALSAAVGYPPGMRTPGGTTPAGPSATTRTDAEAAAYTPAAQAVAAYTSAADTAAAPNGGMPKVGTPKGAAPKGAAPKPASRTAAARKATAREAAARKAAARTKTIDFGGWAIKAPASWRVYRLAADPHGCVRFDIHAIYLGHLGPEQRCPAHIVGHADSVWLDTTVPAPAPAPAAPETASPGASPAARSGPTRQGTPRTASTAGSPHGPAIATIVHDAAADEFHVTASDPGLSATATYGSDRATVQRIIQSLRRAPAPARQAPRTPPTKAPAKSARTAAGGVAAKAPAKSAHTPARVLPAKAPAESARTAARALRAKAARRAARSRSRVPRAILHQPVRSPAAYPPRPVAGFDTCAAPSAAALQAWKGKASVVAVYIGGAERACPDGNLSANWVRKARAGGWHLIPAYVGLQASCQPFAGRINPKSAASEGKAAANDAITDAGKLGIGRGAPLYYDMEGYNVNNSSCRTGVLTFLGAWTGQLHARGYVAGVYSSAASGIHDLATTGSAGGHALPKPDSVWIGLWDGRENLSATPYVAGSAWAGRRRVKQYRGPHWETHGKVRLNIDSDWVYGAVY